MLCERISRLQNSQSNSKRQDNHNIKACAFSPSAVPELCNYCNTSVLCRLQNGAKSRTFLLFTERQFYNRRQQQQDAAWTIGKLFISVQIYYTNRFYISCLISKNSWPTHMLGNRNILGYIARGRLIPKVPCMLKSNHQRTKNILITSNEGFSQKGV